MNSLSINDTLWPVVPPNPGEIWEVWDGRRWKLAIVYDNHSKDIENNNLTHCICLELGTVFQVKTFLWHEHFQQSTISIYVRRCKELR